MDRYDVIVVGAGICGLTAALDLAQAGRRVLVLEADARTGGRAKSLTLPNGVTFNTGANWFHGGDDNPFYQWAKARYDLGPLNEDRAESTRKFMRHGRDVTAHFEALFEEFQKHYEDLRAVRRDDFSLADLAAVSGKDDMRDLAEFWARLWMAADSASCVSAADFFEDPLGVGGWQMLAGLSHLIEQMHADVAARGVEIKTGEIVTKLAREGSEIRVTTKSGLCHAAGQVLVTVSVGVLKSGMIAFDRDVTAMLDEKLAGMTMGHFFKMCLPMKDSFFDGRDIPENFPVCLVEPENPCFIHARTAGKPAITVFTAQGDSMERWDAEKMRGFVYEAIDRCGAFEGFRDHVAGDVVHTSWSNDPLYLGAYAVHRPGSAKIDLPSCGPVMFAGEAMLSDPDDSPGQMSGAWQAGRKAAALLLKL